MATGWWGGLTEQISSMAKDVLTEGTEEIDDHATALQIEQKKTVELLAQNTAIKGENDSLRSKVAELNDSLHSADLQISAVSAEYKNVIVDKEEELKGLKRTIEELNESNRSLLSSPGTSALAADRSHFHHFNKPAHSNGPLFEEDDDFSDVLSHQHEINKLHSELERSRAECLHWKRESKRNTTPQQEKPIVGGDVQALEAERAKLQTLVQELQKQISDEGVRYQLEVTNLHKVSQEKIDSLTSEHRSVQDHLQQQLEHLKSAEARQREDDREEARREGELQEQILQLQEEKEKLGEKLGRYEAELNGANEAIAEFAKNAQEEQASHKRQLHEREKDKMESLRCVNKTLNFVQQREKHKKSRLRSELTSLNEAKVKEISDLESRFEACQQEVTEYRQQLEEVKAENVTLNESLIDLDNDHEVIIGQLIQQRNDLKSQNESLIDEIKSRSLLEASASIVVEKLDAVSHSSTADMSAEVSDLKSKLEASSYALNDLHMGKAEVEDELRTIKAKFKVVVDKCKDLNRQHKEAVAELESAKVSLRQAAGDVVDSESALPTQGDSVADSGEILRLSAEKQQLESQLSENIDELMELRKKMVANTQTQDMEERLRESLNQSQTRNDDLTSLVSQSNLSITEFKDKLDQSQSKIDELNYLLNQSKAKIEEMSDKLNQSRAEEEDNLMAMQQSLDASNDMINTMKSKLEERNSECNDLVSQLASKEETCSKLNTEYQQILEMVREKEATTNLLQAELAKQKEKCAHLVESRNNEADRNMEIDQIKGHLEKANAKLHHQTHLNQTLELELGQKSTQLQQLRVVLEEKDEQITEMDLRLRASEERLDALNVDLSGRKADMSKLEAQLVGRDEEIQRLGGEVMLATERKVQLEKEMMDLTAKLSDIPSSNTSANSRNLDSEPTDTELSHEDMESPRDSNTSMSEVQELKSQLAELQEILAQKVLLINELKGESDETDDSVSPSFSNILIDHTRLRSDTSSTVSMSTQLDQSRNEIEQLKTKLSASADSISTLQSQADQARRESEEIGERMSAVVQDRDLLMTRFNSASDSILTLKTRLDEATSEVAKTKQQLITLDGEKHDLLSKSKNYDDQVSSLTFQLNEANQMTDQQKLEVDALSRGKTKLAAQNQGYCDSISALNSQLEQTKKELKQSELRLESLSQESGEGLVRSQADAETISDLDSQLLEARSQLDISTQRVDELTRDKAELTSRLGEVSENIVSLNAQIDEAKIELHDGKLQLSALSQEKAELLSKGQKDTDLISNLNFQLNQTRRDLELNVNEVRELNAEKGDLLSQIQKAEHSISSLNTQLIQLQTEFEQNKQQTGSEQSKLRTELEQSKLQLETLSREKDQLLSNGYNREAGALQQSPEKLSSIYSDTPKLESQVRALEVEREQMSGVLGEKSREISNLKKQLHSLMELNSSRDAKDMETADMSKQTIRKLSALVKDKEMELEALKQKNESLLAILQTTSGSSSNMAESVTQIAKLLEENQALSQQLSAYLAEREQLVVALQTKHQEAVTFHAEAARLTSLLQQGANNSSPNELNTSGINNGELEKLRTDYHERKEQLVETQHKLSEYKQRCTELMSQLELASRDDNVPKVVHEHLTQEMEALKSRLEKQKEALLEKDRAYEDIQLRLSSQTESQFLAQTECNTLRKQIENLTFELSETRAERDDKQDSFEKCRLQVEQQNDVIKGLRSTEFELQRNMKERERELTQLSSQVSTADTTVDEEKQKLRETVSTLISERDSAHLTAQQNFQGCQDLQKELRNSQDRVGKLEREVDRLRSHLMSIEEGYTADLIQSEDREKELRNRLAIAEEKAAHTSTAVQHASLEASKQITSLEEQLHSVASQRDAAVIQLSNSQEQCAQYSIQLENLQLVLEQFQAEKDSMHAAETQKLQSLLSVSQATVKDLQVQLSKVQGQLDDQCEALEAAQRLSEQLEKKEEAMAALRDEVSMRENKLRESEDRVRTMSTNNEGKVEKLLIKNLVVNYHSAPGAKKSEVLQLIARVLSFTEDELKRVGLGEQQGWIGGIWQRIAHPTSPMQQNPDRSFSELFVKFLESESAPKPTPLPLPVDRMVEEERLRAEFHHRAAFNPFVAPAPISSGPATSRTQQAHPLLVGGQRGHSPLFTSGQPLGGHPLTGQRGNISITPVSTSAPASQPQVSSTPTTDNAVRFVPISTSSLLPTS